MQSGRTKIWARRAGGIALLIVVITGGFTAWNWKSVAAWRAAKQVQSAGSPEERLQAARKLLSCDEAGVKQIVALAQSADPAVSQAICDAIRERMGDPQFTHLAKQLLQTATPGTNREMVLDLMPEFLKHNDTAVTESCRKTVRESLANGSAGELVRAIPLAMRADLNMRSEIVQTMKHPEVEVRRAAMIAVGPITGPDALVSDEEIFHWLHDPDLQVRLLCEVALVNRGLDSPQIDAARKLTHAEASERLTLLNDLRWKSDSIPEPGPWLERLGRDTDPAIRAGAARVACERRLQFAPWVQQLANNDPDPLVRQIAGFHRSQMDIQQVTFP